LSSTLVIVGLFVITLTDSSASFKAARHRSRNIA